MNQINIILVCIILFIDTYDTNVIDEELIAVDWSYVLNVLSRLVLKHLVLA